MPTTLESLRRDAATCTRCPLYEQATQTVFGEGPAGRLVFVGEQPGDAEDRAGRPFVGPAGKLLRELLAETGIDERGVYVTNAVKHFKWRPAGKRRIHDKPNWSEVKACNHWLELELATIEPDLIVCLGATAAQALLGRNARVGALRGRVQESPEHGRVLVTIHPSAVLRAGDERDVRRAELFADLTVAAELIDVGRRQMSKTTKS